MYQIVNIKIFYNDEMENELCWELNKLLMKYYAAIKIKVYGKNILIRSRSIVKQKNNTESYNLVYILQHIHVYICILRFCKYIQHIS